MNENTQPEIQVKFVSIDQMPEWYKEDHQTIKDTNEKLTIHIAKQERFESTINDHETILRGENKTNGLISKVNTLDVRQKIVYGILGTVGVATVSLLVWLVQNAVTVANNLSKIH
jgi:hypothetical protein